MTEMQIKRMGELQNIINAANAELEVLKEQCREAANGEAKAFQCDGVSVTVAKPGKATETLDVKLFAAKAPKTYAEMFEKYHKTGSARAAAVKVYTGK